MRRFATFLVLIGLVFRVFMTDAMALTMALQPTPSKAGSGQHALLAHLEHSPSAAQNARDTHTKDLSTQLSETIAMQTDCCDGKASCCCMNAYLSSPIHIVQPATSVNALIVSLAWPSKTACVAVIKPPLL